jgi:CO/xanthine dehydrogenase Mo-binding subunit
VSGLRFSSRNVLACFEEGARRFGWADRDPRPGLRREGRWLLGTGTAAATYPSGAGHAAWAVNSSWPPRSSSPAVANAGSSACAATYGIAVHPGRVCSGGAWSVVLQDHAAGRGHSQAARRLQEDVRRGLAVRDLVGRDGIPGLGRCSPASSPSGCRTTGPTCTAVP